MAYAPVESIGQRGEEGRNNLGSWVHADPGLGARVLGYWLNRELDASEDAQPFADRGNVDDRYWIKELAQKHAIPFLRSVLPAFARALARDKAQASGVGRYSRQVRLPMMEDDDSWALILGLAGQAAAREDAGTLAVLLQQLPVNDTVATYIKLKAIAANGSELAAQLPILVQQRAELDTDDEEAGWAPFADAGHAAEQVGRFEQR